MDVSFAKFVDRQIRTEDGEPSDATYQRHNSGYNAPEAQIHPANSGSRRVLEKLGFVQEGYFRENFYDPVEAQFTDTALFSLLSAAWMSRAGA
jgi:RimJ/RimL family protein N-acetyltransferase